MRVVIVGGGKVGEVLCAELFQDHDVILIEKDALTFEHIMNKFDITGLVGNGASHDVQLEAGVDMADIFIAASELDEVNIIAAVIAKKLGARYTVARVRNPEYSNQIEFMRESLGISMLINPELSAARDIVRILKYPSALSVETFAGERVSLVEFEIKEESGLSGLSLREFNQRFGSVLVCIIHRGDEIFIPTGDSILQEGDRIHVRVTMGAKQGDMKNFLKVVRRKERVIKSALIVGGGRVGYYVLKFLQTAHMDIKVIERDLARCEFLSCQFPNATIVHDDGTDHDVLTEQAIEEYDAFVSLTGIDEENLISSLFAKYKGIKKVITKMNRTAILKIMDKLRIKSIISPKQVAANEILQFVRARANAEGSNVEALYRIADNQVEALQFKVKRGSSVCGKPLSEISSQHNILITHIIRDKQIIYPEGQDILQPHDRVIIVTTEKGFGDIDDVLR